MSEELREQVFVNMMAACAEAKYEVAEDADNRRIYKAEIEYWEDLSDNLLRNSIR